MDEQIGPSPRDLSSDRRSRNQNEIRAGWKIYLGHSDQATGHPGPYSQMAHLYSQMRPLDGRGKGERLSELAADLVPVKVEVNRDFLLTDQKVFGQFYPAPRTKFGGRA